MEGRYNPSFEYPRCAKQILLPGTGERGKDICDGIEDKISNRIKELKKEGLLKPWYKFW